MKDLINAKLLQYLSDQISQKELYKWSVNMLHKMLKGDILQLDYLEVWGIITGLVEISDIGKKSCDELIQQFRNILLGNAQASFTFAIQIPHKFVMQDLIHLKSSLQKRLEQKELSQKELQELKLLVQKESVSVNTLMELLKSQIINLLKLGYCFRWENTIIFELKSTLFISNDTEMSLEKELLSKIIALLECYNGEKCFFINVRFEGGVGNVSIQA